MTLLFFDVRGVFVCKRVTWFLVRVLKNIGLTHYGTEIAHLLYFMITMSGVKRLRCSCKYYPCFLQSAVIITYTQPFCVFVSCFETPGKNSTISRWPDSIIILETSRLSSYLYRIISFSHWFRYMCDGSCLCVCLVCLFVSFVLGIFVCICFPKRHMDWFVCNWKLSAVLVSTWLYNCQMI